MNPTEYSITGKLEQNPRLMSTDGMGVTEDQAEEGQGQCRSNEGAGVQSWAFLYMNIIYDHQTIPILAPTSHQLGQLLSLVCL